MSVAGVKAIMTQTKDFETEPPRPLMRPIAPPEPFPIEALGGVPRAAADAIVDIVQVPDAMASQSVLAVAALAVQGQADVELPTGQRRPLSYFFVTVAGSGERKSASDCHATAPIETHEK